MTPDVHELAAAYALHALDGDDLVEFENHLASCTDCQRDVRDHQETAALLGAELEASPPASLKAAIMSELDHVTQDRIEPLAEVIDLRSRMRKRAMFAVAAAAVVIAGLIGAIQLRADDQPDRYAAILEADDAQVRELAGEGGALFSVAWSPTEGSFALRGAEVPQIENDETYEFWFIGDGDPINAGLFSPADGTVDLTGVLPGEPAVWAITVEPAGGSPAPTSDIIYLVEA